MRNLMSNEGRNQEIKALHSAGWTQRDIADKFGLNPGHVSRIVRAAGPLDDPQEASKMLRLQDQTRYARGRLREGLRNEEVVRRCAEIAAREIKPFRPVKGPSYTRKEGKVTETFCV